MVWNRTAAQFGRLDPESYDRIGGLGMSRTGIAITAAFLLGLMASPAFAAPSESLYYNYIHAGAPACQRIKDLEKVPALWRATPDSYARILQRLIETGHQLSGHDAPIGMGGDANALLCHGHRPLEALISTMRDGLVVPDTAARSS